MSQVSSIVNVVSGILGLIYLAWTTYSAYYGTILNAYFSYSEKEARIDINNAWRALAIIMMIGPFTAIATIGLAFLVRSPKRSPFLNALIVLSPITLHFLVYIILGMSIPSDVLTTNQQELRTGGGYFVL